MINIEFVKKQHLSMFEQKQEEHRKIVSALYKQYLSDENTKKDNKWLLFGNFYRYLAKYFPAEIYDQEYIVGTNWHWRWQNESEDLIVPINSGHFIPDHYDFLKKGICGKIAEIGTKIKDHPEQETELAGMELSLLALGEYIKHYADAAEALAVSAEGEEKQRLLGIAADCAWISEKPPVSFRQALQLVWFVQIFLDTESGCAAISLGRADDYLYPYYKNDIQNGVLTWEDALKLIMCFYIKVSEGNESTMLTVGGDVDNELTALFLEAQTYLNMRQPSISLRISDTTGETVLNKAKDLVLVGNGMPAYFNDKVIIESLQVMGYDEETARNYGIVGCYEATPQGAFSNTVAGSFFLDHSFRDFLRQSVAYNSFEEFLDCYKAYFEAYYKDTLLPEFKEKAAADSALVSPFASCVLYKDKPYLFGVNILGIGVLIDSLYTIKKLVFEEQFTTIDALRTQAEKDFEDISLYNKILSLDGAYGTNSKESNELAKEITEFIGLVFRRYPIGENMIVFPALFSFTKDIAERMYMGTVNGRRKGELLSYGVMPCATPHKNTVTSVLLSCANISAKYFPDGCPVMISLNKRDVENTDVFFPLIRSFFEAGGYHIAVNTVDAKVLMEAKQNPAEYTDIIVKISGYSTQFTTLDEGIQDAVIERAVQG